MHTEQENSKSGTLQERYQSQGSSVFQLSYLFVIESIRVVTAYQFEPPYSTTHTARARGHLHSQHRVAAPRHLKHPGRPAHARPPTERPCWTRSVAMRPWPSPSQSQPRDDSTGPICGARVRGGSRHTPRPRHGCVTLEPQLGWAPGRHCPRASATHHMPGNTREHASSAWQAQHRPCTRRRAANNLFELSAHSW